MSGQLIRGPCATVRAAVPGHVPGPCPGRARGPVPGPCRASPARARPVPGARAECRARAGPRGPCPARARGPVPSAVPRAGPVPGHVPGAHLPCRNPRARRPRPPSRGRTVVQGPVIDRRSCIIFNFATKASGKCCGTGGVASSTRCGDPGWRPSYLYRRASSATSSCMRARANIRRGIPTPSMVQACKISCASAAFANRSSRL